MHKNYIMHKQRIKMQFNSKGRLKTGRIGKPMSATIDYLKNIYSCELLLCLFKGNIPEKANERA